MKINKLSKVLYTTNLAVIDQKKHWIVQINDKSMKLCHNTFDPKTNIFWYRANPN